jgi:hypothetical protein
MPAGDNAPWRPVVERCLADPPVVHLMDVEGRLGLWSTEADCYRFLAERGATAGTTLETGAGLSTVILAAVGARHTAVTPLGDEVDRLREYCAERDISLERVEFCIGRSERVLPDLDDGELGLVLIDGNHGFPVPMADFLYGAGRLRRGGVLVVDDLQLAVPGLLAQFCDLDDGWRPITRTAKWGAWERMSEGPLHDDHYHQPFLVKAWDPDRLRSPLRWTARRAVSKVRYEMRKLSSSSRRR